MFKNATARGGSGFKTNTTPRQDRQFRSTETRSAPAIPSSKGSIKGMLTKTKASFSIDHRTISVSVEIPDDFRSELLEAFAEKLKADFIKNLYDIATLPSNFRTPFLKKMKEREDQPCSIRTLRAWSIRDLFALSACSQVQAVLPADPHIIERSNTKDAQLSIGVTASALTYQSIERLAIARTESVNKIACELFVLGLTELGTRLSDDDDEVVFRHFESKLEKSQNYSPRRWMLRVDRRVYNRTSLLAQEFGKSLAHIALLCIAHSLSNHEQFIKQTEALD